MPFLAKKGLAGGLKSHWLWLGSEKKKTLKGYAS